MKGAMEVKIIQGVEGRTVRSNNEMYSIVQKFENRNTYGLLVLKPERRKEESHSEELEG